MPEEFDLNGIFRQGAKMSDSWYHNNESSAQFGADYALAQLANKQEIDMWNMQNAYNTPAAQMERFKAAGLNPNLVYQMGTPGNASSAPGVHQSQAPNYTQAKVAKIQNAMAVVNGVSNLAQAVFGIIGGVQELDARRMANEQSRMQLEVDRKLYRSVGSPTDLGSGAYGFEARFMPKASKLGLDYTIMPFRMSSMDSATRYRDYYTNTILPLMRNLTQGRIDALGFSNKLLDYQYQYMAGMSPAERNLWLRLNNLMGLAGGLSKLF